jgi:hypothetical protein
VRSAPPHLDETQALQYRHDLAGLENGQGGHG